MTTSTLTDRYVWAVLRAIPEEKRADIEKELRASIADAVEARVEAGEGEADAELAELKELGEPARLAAGYVGRPLALIGPDLYVDYVKLLRLLLVLVVPISAVVLLFVNALGGATVGELIGGTVTTILTVGVHLCFWTTLVFVFLERTGTKAPLAPFDPALLAPVPEKNAPKISELVATLIFFVFTAGGIVWQQFSSVFVDSSGAPIPMLNPALWSFWLPYFIALAVLTAVHAIVVWRAGRWTWPLAAANVVLNAAVAIPLIWLLLSEQLLNRAFFADFGWAAAIAPGGEASTAAALAIGILAFIMSVDGFVKVRRSTRAYSDLLKDQMRRLLGPALKSRNADHALLSHRGQEGSVAGEDAAERQAAAAEGDGGFLFVEQPLLVDPAVAVPPHRVVEARGLESVGAPRDAVGAHDRLEDDVVARVREGSAVQVGVVGQPTDGPHPHRLSRRALALAGEVDRMPDMADVERALGGPELRDRVVDAAESFGRARQRLGVGQVGRHRHRVLETSVGVLERRDHREDRLPALVALRAPRRERPAVVDAVHREGDRLLDIARPQEVAVHRMHLALLGDGAARGDQRLRQHLSAEHSTAGHPLARTGENVFPGARPGVGQIEGGQEARQGIAHEL